MQSDLDAWWADQAARRPSRYHLWRAPRGRPTVIVQTSNDQVVIAAAARRLKQPCVVIDTWPRSSSSDPVWPLQIRSDGVELGAWAVERPGMVARRIAAAEALRFLEDGTPVRRRLGLHAGAARQAAKDLRLGSVVVRGVWHPLPGGRDRSLEVVAGGGGLVVRRGQP